MGRNAYVLQYPWTTLAVTLPLDWGTLCTVVAGRVGFLYQDFPTLHPSWVQ